MANGSTPIALEYRHDFRRDASNESMRILAELRPTLKLDVATLQLEIQLAEYPGSLCLPATDDVPRNEALLSRLKRVLFLGPAIGLGVIVIGAVLTTNPPLILLETVGVWGANVLSWIALLCGGSIQFGSIYFWRWAVARTIRARLPVRQKRARGNRLYRSRVVSIEDPHTFHVSKSLGDDTGLLFFEPDCWRIRLETLRYRHFIRVSDVDRVEHIRYRTSSAVLLVYRIGQLHLGLVLARSEKYVISLFYPVHSSLLKPLQRFVMEGRRAMQPGLPGA